MFSAPIIEAALLLVHQLFPDVRRPSRSSPWRLTSRSRGCSWTRSPSPSEASDGRRNSFSDKSISNTLSTIVIYDSSVVNYDCLAFTRLTNKSRHLILTPNDQSLEILKNFYLLFAHVVKTKKRPRMGLFFIIYQFWIRLVCKSLFSHRDSNSNRLCQMLAPQTAFISLTKQLNFQSSNTLL